MGTTGDRSETRKGLNDEGREVSDRAGDSRLQFPKCKDSYQPKGPSAWL